MFDEKFRAQYENIKAPDELYSRIMNAEAPEVKKNNTVLFRKIAATAAAAAVVLTASVFFIGRPVVPDIYIGEEKLTGEVTLSEEESPALMLARAGNEVKCELTLSIEKDTFISISEGFLFDVDGNLLLDAEEGKNFSEELFCSWNVPNADSEKQYEMTLRDKNGTYIITLSFDSFLGKWTVGLTE